jgi:hypothetical protein
MLHCIELLGTECCRETVPMERPVPNSSMQHPDPDLDFDDMRMCLTGGWCRGQGDSCGTANLALIWLSDNLGRPPGEIR